ncbi:hypothetical protein EG328_005971 [Venturia inaequalis]|uniref:Uncharacterized protein n=1 Tax=Venturia inaequalis TaxID=5025 RepID=A0A8H3UIL8_VENIN|nr:hypothetical protein EG328_005971 [Venturia inaequalis]
MKFSIAAFVLALATASTAVPNVTEHDETRRPPCNFTLQCGQPEPHGRRQEPRQPNETGHSLPMSMLIPETWRGWEMWVRPHLLEAVRQGWMLPFL